MSYSSQTNLRIPFLVGLGHVNVSWYDTFAVKRSIKLPKYSNCGHQIFIMGLFFAYIYWLYSENNKGGYKVVCLLHAAHNFILFEVAILCMRFGLIP